MATNKNFEVKNGLSIAGTERISSAGVGTFTDLNVTGTTTTIDTATLQVQDKNIVINYGSGDTSSTASGAGITIQDAVNSSTDATLLWDASADEFDFSHTVTAPTLTIAGAATFDTDTLVVDATNDRVGIGTASPQAGLDITSSSKGTWSSGNTYHIPSGNAYIKVQGTAAQDNWIGITGGYDQSSGSANLLLQANLRLVNEQAGNYISSEAQSSTAADITFGKMIGGSTTSGNSTKSEFMRIDSSGNVGIGTDNPASPLHVNITGAGDAVKIQGNSITDFDFVGNPPEFNLEDTSSTSGSKRARMTLDNNLLQIQGVSDDDATLNYTFLSCNLANGKVGIAETNPSEKLDVQGSIKVGTGLKISSTPASGSIGFNRNPADGTTYTAGLQRFQINGPFSGNDFLDFQSYDSSGTYTGSFYLNGGKVGIGANNPAVSLDVGSKTDAIKVPNGTTAQKPTGATGMIRYNSTSSKLEAYIDSEWKNVTATSQSLTGITGLDLWADVTGGISSTTIADLSGNNRTGTLSNTGHSGTLNGNTYMLFNASNRYLSYGDKPSGLGDYPGNVTFFFVLTNTTGFSTYRTLIGDSSGTAGYQILRTNGSTNNWNFYLLNQQGKVLTSTNTVLNSAASISTTQILIFSFGSQSSGNLTIYKRTGGTESTDTYTGEFATNAVWAFSTNTSSSFYIGNSDWAGEYYDGGMFAWGIIDHEITSSEKQTIYDYYAAKNIGN